ncbi:MAG TPA: S8 family serine peptidase, partial [Pyrinomonadaceae bacterium]|nr:S8 family serine peptidase [Pyrinomonadaceae bacterium]
AKHFPTAEGFDRARLFPMAGTPNPPAGSMAQRYVFIDNLVGPWPSSVSGRIALVREPGLTSVTFFDISQTAAASGAVGMIYISTTQNPTAVTGSIPSANILPADGEILIDAISSTDDNNVDLPNGAVSELPIRMNPTFTDAFMGEMAGFSSRGPVRGLGQVKPDVSAPGVAVLAACPPASLLGALAAASTPTSPNYIAIDGTSMATPHTAGAAALITQANPDWTPDVIRTVLINTATNMRDQAGASKPDGLTADSIIAQGGGLIDVKEALNAKAIMGVAGDGITKPGILGSHSFGEVPVINSRVTHTSPVNVVVRDLSGQSGTFNLAIANNRDLQLAGINVTLSQSSVNVGPNGEVSFTVSATVDGDLLRDVMAEKTVGSQVIFEKIQMQWFVTAVRSDGGESLRMPFFFRPGPSMPAEPVVVTTQHTDIMPAGDGGAQRDALGFEPVLSGVTYKDVPFEVDASTLRIEALTEWEQVAETGQPDLDYQLLDPDGNLVTQSGNGVGPEFVSVRVSRFGIYVHRVIGFTNVATEFTITTTLTKGNTPPVLHSIVGDFTNAQGTPVDFDGNIDLTWEPTNGATGYEVERSSNGTDYSVVASLGAGQTSTSLTDQPAGEISYRVRAFAAGQIGSYVTAHSNVAAVVIDPRTQVDITAQVSTAMTNVSFVGGVFSMNLNLTNNSTSSYVPRVDLNVVGITSASGTVSVRNADNGGNGTSSASPALFGYSNLLGADETFSPAETTGSRTLEFNDTAAEMFTFDIAVTAYQQTGGGGGAGAGGSGGEATGSAGDGTSGSSLQSLTRLLRITVNPLTKTVSAKLL